MYKRIYVLRLKVAEWDDASDDFDSSLEATGINPSKSVQLGSNKHPPVRGDNNERASSASTSWGVPAAIAKMSVTEPAAADGDEEYSGYSVEEDISSDDIEERDNAKYSFSESGRTNPPSKSGSGVKSNNQDDDSYENSFSIESKKGATAGAEEDDYEQDDFEFEEEAKSIPAGDRDDSLSLDKSAVSPDAFKPLLFITSLLFRTVVG